MIHPNTKLQFINDEIGFGVVATDFIPAGTITWVLDPLDREFTTKMVEDLHELYKETIDTYAYRNNKGNYIFCWDNARFVNHSFNANCLTSAYDFEVAIRDIQPGEQLTDDYGYLNLEEPFYAADEGTKRKVVYPDDLLRYGDIWDKTLIKTFSNVPNVKQPLRALISDDTWEEIQNVVYEEKPMRSIKSTYFQET